MALVGHIEHEDTQHIYLYLKINTVDIYLSIYSFDCLVCAFSKIYYNIVVCKLFLMHMHIQSAN